MQIQSFRSNLNRFQWFGTIANCTISHFRQRVQSETTRSFNYVHLRWAQILPWTRSISATVHRLPGSLDDQQPPVLVGRGSEQGSCGSGRWPNRPAGSRIHRYWHGQRWRWWPCAPDLGSHQQYGRRLSPAAPRWSLAKHFQRDVFLVRSAFLLLDPSKTYLPNSEMSDLKKTDCEITDFEIAIQ